MELWVRGGRALSVSKKKEVYTRPLLLTSCQEDRLGLDYTVLCYAMADLVINLATRSWKECSERIFSGAPMEIRPPGFLVRGWSQELNGSARGLGDALTFFFYMPLPL